MKFLKLMDYTLLACLLLAFSLLSNPAQAAIANCAVMDNSGTICSSCNPGYQVANGGSSCVQVNCSAMANCQLCDTTSTCLNCDFGYELNLYKTACSKIVCSDSNCNLCSSVATQSCYGCLSHYFV